MTYFVKEEKGRQKAYKTLEIETGRLKVLSSKLAMKIIRALSEKPGCAMDIGRDLKEHEQKIYYHIRRMEEAGIVELLKREERGGGYAKIYAIRYPYLSARLFDSKPLVDVKTKVRELDFFSSFIENGNLKAIIVVGSPDPHGKYGAQASDSCCAIDLALFLGTFLKGIEPNYKLDTEIRESDLENSLILIGGPKANMVLDRINKELPIYFDIEHEFNIVSTFSKSTYSDDNVGAIIKIQSPFSKDKEVLVLSGRRFNGTKASIIALVKYQREMEKGNKFNGDTARIVRGIDRNADGRIDDVEFLE